MDELTPTLAVVAEQAKIQVVFDPDVVSAYRLIGYENRTLDDGQFVDDTVDAGELGAGHQVSALYELQLADGAERAVSTVGTVHLRWQDPRHRHRAPARPRHRRPPGRRRQPVAAPRRPGRRRRRGVEGQLGRRRHAA